MKTFLQDCAESIYKIHGNDVQKIAIVLPGRRAGRFFKRYYSELAGQSIWSPKILAFDQFLEEVSEKKTLDSTSLLFELYAAYQEEFPKEAEPFEQFSSWGSMALRDFNEIDNYLIDPNKIFKDITNLKEIEEWSLNLDELTTEQINYADFWKKLGRLYKAFSKRLEKHQLESTGRMKRWCTQNMEKWSGKMDFSHVWFLGLNALTRAEKKIIYGLEDKNLATCLWDFDEYYADNPLQEAGLFFRELQRDGRKLNEKYSLLKNGKKDIRILATASRVGQAKLLADVLNESSSQAEKSAVVLTDESMLLPVLHSLPEATEKVNITMGLPLEFTSLKVVFDSHLELLENREKNRGNDNKIYFRDFLKCLMQPSINSLVENYKSGLADELVKTIRKQNIIQLDLEELVEKYPEFEPVADLFRQPEGIVELTTLQRKLTESLKEIISDSLHEEMLFRFSVLINKLSNYLEKYPFITTVHGYRKLWHQLLRQESLSFVGEPLSGLQILGMLETRAVDFEHVVILSSNEEILPKSKFDQSFIPFELKKLYGLPTYQQRDAIYAYYFYRLLQRAKNVDLVYSTASEDFGSSEKSRFLTQIQYELPKYNPEISISESVVHTPISATKVVTEMEKTDKILLKLDDYLDYGVSPSAMNTFLKCPLDFFYKYVMKLREQEEVEEKIERSTFGDIVHEALEKLYEPFVEQKISSETIATMLAKAAGMVEKKFIEKYSTNTSRGENHLVFEVAQEYVNRFLKMEINSMKEAEDAQRPVKIRSLEEKLKASLNLANYGFEKALRLKGKADRIDQVGDEIRVIDYKTGRVEPRDVSIATLADLSKKPKALQLLLYTLMYAEMNPGILEKIRPGIISLKNISSGFMPLKIAGSTTITKENLEEFKYSLADIFSEIYNKEVPFVHDSSSRYCDYCT